VDSVTSSLIMFRVSTVTTHHAFGLAQAAIVMA